MSYPQDRVGWRDSSLARRLVLAITDDEYHYALDGKVAAIVNRHDGRCHLDDDGFYDEDTNFVRYTNSYCTGLNNYPFMKQLKSLAAPAVSIPLTSVANLLCQDTSF